MIGCPSTSATREFGPSTHRSATWPPTPPPATSADSRARSRSTASCPSTRPRRCRRRRRRRACTFVEQVLSGKRMTAAAARGVRVARVRRPAARPRRLRPRPDRQGLCSTSRSPSRGAFCRCTSAATGCSSRRPTRPTCRRWRKSASRPTSSSSRSSSRTTSSAQAIAQARRGERRDAARRWRRSRTSRSRSRTARPAGHRRRGQRRRGRAGRQVHPEDPARRDRRRRVRHPLRAVREVLPHPLPPRRHPDGGRAAAARDQGQGRVADQGHLQARHLGKARAAGRPDEARAVEDARRSTSACRRCRRSSARRS